MSPKEAFAKAVESAGGFRTARLGSELWIFCGDNAEEVKARMIKKAIRSGERIEWSATHWEFYEWVEIYNPRRSGSGCFEWHADGNRVKQELVRTSSNAGVVSRDVIKTDWRKPIGC